MTDVPESIRAALAPPRRAPDRGFVLKVTARLRFEQQARLLRRAALRQIVAQGLALAATAAGLWWIWQAPDLARIAAESPDLALVAIGAVLSATTLLIAASRRRGRRGRPARRAISTT